MECHKQQTPLRGSEGPKPVKPRTGVIDWTDDACRRYGYEAIELTDEVRKAIEDAGIEI